MALGAWPGPREGPVASKSDVVSVLTVNTRDLRKLVVAGAMLRRHRLGDGSVTSTLRGHQRIGDNATGIVASNSRARSNTGSKEK